MDDEDPEREHADEGEQDHLRRFEPVQAMAAVEDQLRAQVIATESAMKPIQSNFTGLRAV